jgi:hypothetical protein
VPKTVPQLSASPVAWLLRHPDRRRAAEPAGVRRTIFGRAAGERDHRNGGASLDRRGEMTLPQNCKSSVIPLFVQNTDHSSVPTKTCTAVARGGGPGRPPGRRASASPLTAAGTMAALRSLGTMLRIVVILAASMLSGGPAHAEQGSSATRRSNDLSVRPFAAFVTEASVYQNIGYARCCTSKAAPNSKLDQKGAPWD